MGGERMSVEAVSWALNAPVGGSVKVMLLGLANHAQPDGTESYPSLDTLAHYGACNRSTARRGVRELVRLGWIVPDGEGPRGTVKYTLAMWIPTAAQVGVPDCHPQSEGGGTHATPGGGTGATPGVAPMPPEPSLNQEDSLRSSSSSGESAEVEAAAQPEPEPLIAPDDIECVRLGRLINDLRRERNPKAKVGSTAQPELLELRRLHRIDGWAFPEIEAVIRWLYASPNDQRAEFWATNIRSAKKLRIQFDRLWEQMPAARRPGGSAATVAPIDPSAASPAAVQRWEPALARLRDGMDDATFGLWIEPLVPQRLDAGCLVLAVPAGIVRRVESRLADVIAQAVGGPVAFVPVANPTEQVAAA